MSGLKRLKMFELFLQDYRGWVLEKWFFVGWIGVDCIYNVIDITKYYNFF